MKTHVSPARYALAALIVTGTILLSLGIICGLSAVISLTTPFPVSSLLCVIIGVVFGVIIRRYLQNRFLRWLNRSILGLTAKETEYAMKHQ